jgi:PAS domain S-box-containing protein
MNGKIKLLIVDDEEGMRETIKEIFKKRNFQVETASNGKDAIDLIKKEFYNVVILDMRLPDMEGTEVLKSIKKESPDIEVVIITAFASLQSSIDAINEGAYGYLMKPFEMDSLVKVVSSAEERRGLIMENRQLRSFNENIVQSLNEGILIEDEHGFITFVNPKIEEMVGHPEEEIIGKTFKDFTPPGKQGFESGQTIPIQKEERRETVIVGKDENSIPVLISTVTLFEGEKRSGALSVLTDISEIKRLEVELKEKIEELEHFNKLMVGRELRMVELKNQLRDLENKTPKG